MICSYLGLENTNMKWKGTKMSIVIFLPITIPEFSSSLIFGLSIENLGLENEAFFFHLPLKKLLSSSLVHNLELMVYIYTYDSTQQSFTVIYSHKFF